MDTTIEIRYDGGKLTLETRLDGATLSYPLGCYSNILLPVTFYNMAKFPNDVLLANCRICTNRSKGLIKQSTGMDVGPSVYHVQCWEGQYSLRTLTPLLVPDELPIEIFLEMMAGTDFPDKIVWQESKRLMDVRTALGIQPSNAWAKLEGLAEEAGLTGELTGKETKYFGGDA